MAQILFHFSILVLFNRSSQFRRRNWIFRPHDSLTRKDMSSRFLPHNLTSQTEAPGDANTIHRSFSYNIKTFTLTVTKQASLVYRSRHSLSKATITLLHTRVRNWQRKNNYTYLLPITEIKLNTLITSFHRSTPIIPADSDNLSCFSLKLVDKLYPTIPR